jgi:NAD-dependent deacetylase
VQDNSEQRGTLDVAASLLQQASLAVLFSGAGFSTPSGIPDFRSPKTGLWNQDNPMECASLSTFTQTPERFFNWLHPLAKKMYSAKPNNGHIAAAQMEERGIIKAVVTQNIDGLHQKSGSKEVIELHGSIHTATCSHCHQSIKADKYLPKFIETGQIPTCSRCKGIIKPGITLFEELLPMKAWQDADKISQECDLMIIAGSSLEVIPASSIPQQAIRQGAKIIIINYSPTFLDQDATCIFHEGIEIILPRLNRMLL